MFGVVIPFEAWVVLGLVAALAVAYLIRTVVGLNRRVSALEREVARLGQGTDRK